MKKTLLISVLLITISAYSQVDSLQVPTNINIKQKRQDELKLIGFYAASIILNGVGDGLNNSNHKTAGHVINALSIAMLVTSPFFIDYNKKKWYWYLATYTSLRIGLFDSAYNLTRELPFGYVGTTSPTDKFYNLIGLNPILPRPLFLGIGITIPLTKL
jgi:hypothetical protein